MNRKLRRRSGFVNGLQKHNLGTPQGKRHFMWQSFILLACLASMANASVATIVPGTAGSSASAGTSSEEIRKWRLRQLQLYQIRTTLLSEALSKRIAKSISSVGTAGAPASTVVSNILPTIQSVSTVEGSQPVMTDWDCALSTEAHPKSCLYSFDAPPNAKVVAPAGTTKWITLSSLNRLRRLDPTKVEPMWHNQYLIQKSWFGRESTSMLQHVGIKGFFISSILLDRPVVLRSLLALGVFLTLVSILPAIEYMYSFFVLNNSLVWMKYNNWARFLHAAFPFKLLLAQMAWKFLASKFEVLQRAVLDHIVDMECVILEESVPITLRDEDEKEAELIVDEEHVVDVMVDGDRKESFFEEEELSNYDESSYDNASELEEDIYESENE